MQIKINRILHKIRCKGSLICLSIMMIIPQTALAASVPSDMVNFTVPAEMSVDDAKNGIVRVISGTVDEEGSFNPKRTATGFIVSKNGNSVYIITSTKDVDLGENGKIRIVIKNDSTVDATIEQPYQEKGFCLLAAENKFNDKSEVALRIPSLDDEKNKLSDGDEITALGFPSSLNNTSEFAASDVSGQKGNIIKTAAENSGYIEYGASIPEGFEGGVLVDKDGYAVGLIREGSNTALDITEVDTALYKENILYRSRDKDLMYAELYDLCANAESTYKRADKDTKKEIKRTRELAMRVLEGGPYSRDDLRNALDDFNGVIKGGGWKLDKTLLLVIILGAVIVYLTVRLILLIVWNKRNDPDGRFSDKRERKERRVFRKKPKPEKNDTGKGRNTERISGLKVETYPPQLLVLRTGRSFILNSAMATLGKSQDSDLSIPDNNKISRHHASIAVRNGQYYLYDQGSTNGTFLNNMPVDSNGMRLISGDIIRLANEEIQFIQQ